LALKAKKALTAADHKACGVNRPRVHADFQVRPVNRYELLDQQVEGTEVHVLNAAEAVQLAFCAGSPAVQSSFN
jgi:hypothetical protein